MIIKQAPKLKKNKSDCLKCRNYLHTNPLCKLGRKTPRKVCKWFTAGKTVKPKKLPKATGKTMAEVCENILKSIAERNG